MIRRHIIGFSDSDPGGPRRGSCVIFTDGKEVVVIDGYLGAGAKKLIKYLKKIGCRSPWLYLTHAHGDHYEGLQEILEDPWFSPKGFRCYDPASIKAGANKNSEIRSDYNALIDIIALCKAKGVPVRYVHSSDSYVHGEIKFKVYREQTAFLGNAKDPHGWEYLNNGSLIFWFHELGTLVTGDGPEWLGDFCKNRDIHAKDFQISHHGGSCNQGQSRTMKSLGAVYCWDDNYAADGGSSIFRYACSYKGKPTLKGHTADTTRKVLRGSYGSGDTRTTNLLDEGYNPGLVQKSVNSVINTAKGILSGKLDYGVNKTRIARLDKEFGAGYGQLIQDYINVLAGVRKEV